MPQKHNKSQSRKAQYATYKTQSRYAANKKAKLERHLKKYPNDEKAKQALKDISSTPKRGTPESTMWSSQQREVAQMFASVGINGHHALNNAKVSARLDAEHLRFDAEYKESLMKKESKNKIPTAKKKSKPSKKTKSD